MVYIFYFYFSFQERLLDFPLVHVVLCNEACDLDSAVSAVTYAYYLHEVTLIIDGSFIQWNP